MVVSRGAVFEVNYLPWPTFHEVTDVTALHPGNFFSCYWLTVALIHRNHRHPHLSTAISQIGASSEEADKKTHTIYRGDSGTGGKEVV